MEFLLEYGTNEKDLKNIFNYKYYNKERREGNKEFTYKLERDEKGYYFIKGIKDVYDWNNRSGWQIRKGGN